MIQENDDFEEDHFEEDYENDFVDDVEEEEYEEYEFLMNKAADISLEKTVLNNELEKVASIASGGDAWRTKEIFDMLFEHYKKTDKLYNFIFSKENLEHADTLYQRAIHLVPHSIDAHIQLASTRTKLINHSELYYAPVSQIEQIMLNSDETQKVLEVIEQIETFEDGMADAHNLKATMYRMLATRLERAMYFVFKFNHVDIKPYNNVLARFHGKAAEESYKEFKRNKTATARRNQAVALLNRIVFKEEANGGPYPEYEKDAKGALNVLQRIEIPQGESDYGRQLFDSNRWENMGHAYKMLKKYEMALFAYKEAAALSEKCELDYREITANITEMENKIKDNNDNKRK